MTDKTKEQSFPEDIVELIIGYWANLKTTTANWVCMPKTCWV